MITSRPRSGSRAHSIKCLWFNAAYLEDRFNPGDVLALYGKVEDDQRGRGLKIMQPQIEVLREAGAEKVDPKESLETGRIVPIYEAVGKMNARWFRRAVRTGLEVLNPEVPEVLPSAVRKRNGLIAARGVLEGSLAGSR